MPVHCLNKDPQNPSIVHMDYKDMAAHLISAASSDTLIAFLQQNSQSDIITTITSHFKPVFQGIGATNITKLNS